MTRVEWLLDPPDPAALSRFRRLRATFFALGDLALFLFVFLTLLVFAALLFLFEVRWSGHVLSCWYGQREYAPDDPNVSNRDRVGLLFPRNSGEYVLTVGVMDSRPRRSNLAVGLPVSCLLLGLALHRPESRGGVRCFVAAS